MRIFARLFILLILCTPHICQAAQLHDRLMTQKLFNNSAQALIGKNTFKERFERLDIPTRQRIQKLGGQLESILPPRILESYLTWRIISPNDKKAVDVLKYALFYRLLILRDTIDSPLSTPKQVKIAQTLLKDFTQIPEIATDNIWNLTHQLMEHKAKTLNSIEDDLTLAMALEETPWLEQKLEIPNIAPYVLSSLGHLNANSLSWIDKKSMLKEFKVLISNFKELFTIEGQVLLQFPRFTETLMEKIKASKDSSHRFQIIFHTPEDQTSLIEWENFRKNNKILESKLSFIIAPQTLSEGHTASNTTSIEAAPLYPRELDAISSFGGLISIDPTSAEPTTILTGPTPIPRDSALKLKGAAAAALVLANEQIPVDNRLSRILNQKYDLQKEHKVRLARLLPKQKIIEIRPILVYMISRAQKEILIDQFFIFDAHIVQSLIKRKIQKPQLDIRILMDHNLDYSMGGFPNTLFLSDMIRNGIEIKSRKIQTSNSANIIVDSRVALLGPQNLMPTQLEASSTIQSLQVFDQKLLKSKVSSFKNDWEDKTKLYNFNIKEFRFITPTEILDRDDSKLLNAIGSEFLRQFD